MKRAVLIFQIFLAVFALSSCKKDPLPNAEGIGMTPVYHVYNKDQTADLTSDAYEFYIYREYPMLTQFDRANDLGVSIYKTEQFVDDSDATYWDFSFIRVADNGSRKRYEVWGYRDRSLQPVLDDAGNPVTDNLGVPVQERKDLKLTISTLNDAGQTTAIETIPTAEVFDVYRAIEM